MVRTPLSRNTGSSLITPLKRAAKNLRDLDTEVTFYKFIATDGPEAGEVEEKVLFECMAEVDTVWLRDLEQAIANGTESNLKIFIRDTLGEYVPNGDTDYVSINYYMFQDKRFNILNVQPDPRDKRFIMITAGVKDAD
ncbi:phage head completion protein [Macrococcus bovicus]|uniref:Phage head-tail adapter protein n=1 Tax=Macrococcus bovicus TaxID=69968 RepID=A0A4R6C2W1_9STAP|nr:head-tail adaptor protein [Macrococcus bovicus]TDM15702.1 phage head-tail adapter protein [Macrococcus bovicus]